MNYSTVHQTFQLSKRGFPFPLFIFLFLSCNHTVVFGQKSEYQPEKLSEIMKYKTSKGMMHFRENKVRQLKDFTGEKIVSKYGYLFDLNEGSEMKFRESHTSHYKAAGAITKHFFDLYYKGYQVEKKGASFKEKGGFVTEGIIADLDLSHLDLTVILSREEAIEIAKKRINATKYLWEEYLNEEIANSVYPNPILKIVKVEDTYHFIYEMIIYTWKPEYHLYKVLVHPNSKEVIHVQSMMNYCDEGFVNR